MKREGLNGSRHAKDPGWYLSLLAGMGKVRLANKPVPLMTQWEITYACNLKCVFCTTRLHPKAWSPETTTDEAIDIIDQIARMGTKILNVVGGEPTIRKDLPILFRHARLRGIRVSVTTHGVLTDEKRAWLLEADIVRVSLEGAAALNSALRVAPAKFNATEETVETLRFLAARGRKPMIASVFTSQTRDEDIAYLAGLCREMGIRMNLKPVVAFNFGDKMDGFTPEEAAARIDGTANICMPLDDSMRRIAAYRDKYPDCIVSGEPETEVLKQGGLDKAGCRAMDTALCLKADGSVVMPCIEYPKYIVKSRDLASVYYGDVAEKARREQGRDWFCKECQLSCMIHASALVSFKPLWKMARSYFPMALNS